jgi:hypothetical protein
MYPTILSPSKQPANPPHFLPRALPYVQYPLLVRTHCVVKELRISNVRPIFRWERLLLSPIYEREQRLVRFNGYVQPFIGQNEGAQVRAATEEIGYDASKYTVRGNEWVVVVEERWNESDVDFGVLDGGVCGIEGFAVELKLIEI